MARRTVLKLAVIECHVGKRRAQCQVLRSEFYVSLVIRVCATAFVHRSPSRLAEQNDARRSRRLKIELFQRNLYANGIALEDRTASVAVNAPKIRARQPLVELGIRGQ
jgi:hypothetical protein